MAPRPEPETRAPFGLGGCATLVQPTSNSFQTLCTPKIQMANTPSLLFLSCASPSLGPAALGLHRKASGKSAMVLKALAFFIFTLRIKLSCFLSHLCLFTLKGALENATICWPRATLSVPGLCETKTSPPSEAMCEEPPRGP